MKAIDAGLARVVEVEMPNWRRGLVEVKLYVHAEGEAGQVLFDALAELMRHGNVRLRIDPMVDPIPKIEP